MDRLKRGKMVLAMERIARAVNDEEVFEYWLAYGVADGDIDDSTTPEDEILDCYCEDGTFRDLMDAFLHLMRGARKSGGLYVDNVVTEQG